MESNYQKFLKLFGLRAVSVIIDSEGVATVVDSTTNLEIVFGNEKTPSVVQDNQLDPKYVKLNELYKTMTSLMVNFKDVREMYRYTTEDTLKITICIRNELMHATFKETV